MMGRWLNCPHNGYEVTLFTDARAIVKGTEDESIARGLYAKYVGACNVSCEAWCREFGNLNRLRTLRR